MTRKRAKVVLVVGLLLSLGSPGLPWTAVWLVVGWFLMVVAAGILLRVREGPDTLPSHMWVGKRHDSGGH